MKREKEKATAWVAREWLDDGKIKREKKPDATVSGVKPTDQFVVQWIEPSGKRRLRKAEALGRNGLKEAFSLRDQIASQLRNGTYQDPAPARHSKPAGETWASFRTRFEKNHLDSNPDLRPATAKLYRQSLDVFERLIAPDLLTDVSTVIVDDFRAAMADEETGAETIKRHLRGLRVAMRKAWEWELVEKLPRFKNLGSGSNEPRPLSDEHFRSLYRVLGLSPEKGGPKFPAAQDQPFSASAWWRGVLVTAAFTGLRRTEWLRLPWSDVSLDKAELVIRKARNKGKRDDRIPLHPIVVAHLRKLSDYGRDVFPWTRYVAGRDKPLGMQALYREWHALQEKAGITEPYCFHNLRDHCLSGFAKFMTPAALNLFARHSDFAVTQKHYLHPETVMQGAMSNVPVPAWMEM